MLLLAVILNYAMLLMAAENYLTLITTGYYRSVPYLLFVVACPTFNLLVITTKPRGGLSLFARKAMRTLAIILNIAVLWVGVGNLLHYITQGAYIAGPFGWFRCMGVFVLVACPTVNLLVIIVDMMPDWKYRKHTIAVLVIGEVAFIVWVVKCLSIVF